MKKFSKIFQDNGGGIAVIAAFAIPMILIAASLAIDYNRYLKSSGHIQNAVDQAAIAAVSVDGQNRTEVAERFFNASLTTDIKKTVSLASMNVIEEFPPGGPLSVTVEATLAVDTWIGSLLGIQTMKVNRLGQATRNVEKVEAVITMASNGTMCSSKTRIPAADVIDGDTMLSLAPDPLCASFESMRQGVFEFVDLVESNSTISEVKVGLVPYNFKVRMPNPNNIPATLTANEPSSFYTDVSDAEPLSPVLPLTSNISRVENTIMNLRQTPEGVAWSRTDLATHVAGLMLSPNEQGSFPGGETPSQFSDPTTQKVVIMMTDGANIGCCFTNWPLENFRNQYVYFYEPYNEAQLEICDILKDNNVRIFSILFDVNDSDPGGKEINNVFSRCASGAYAERGMADDPDAMLKCKDKQYCYNVDNDQELIKAYHQIAQTFYKPTITK